MIIIPLHIVISIYCLEHYRPINTWLIHRKYLFTLVLFPQFQNKWTLSTAFCGDQLRRATATPSLHGPERRGSTDFPTHRRPTHYHLLFLGPAVDQEPIRFILLKFCVLFSGKRGAVSVCGKRSTFLHTSPWTCRIGYNVWGPDPRLSIFVFKKCS